MAYADGIAIYHTCLLVSAGVLEIANVIPGALEVFWLYLYLYHQI